MSTVLTQKSLKIRFLFKSALVIAIAAVGLTLVNLSRATAACSAQNPDLGVATQTINVASSGTYRAWSRIMAGSTTANSYLLEVDGGACITVGDAAVSTSAWTWVDYQGGNSSTKINLSLTAGSHTIKMIGKEANVKLDKVIFTADSSCVPDGDGGNCVVLPDNTPPSVTMTAPADNSTVSGTITLSASASDASGISKVEFRNNNQLILTEVTAPYSHTLDTTTLADGAYTLSARAFDNAGNVSTDSIVRITVDNQPEGNPDLVIESVSLSPSSPNVGQQVRFSIVVKNQGTAATALGTNHGAQFTLDGTVVNWTGNNTAISIPAGGTQTITANNGPTGSAYWTATEGTHNLLARIDDLNLIAETDDSNNSANTSFTVAPPPDTQAPTVPAGVSANANSSTQATVSWQPSSDNIGVTSYWIKRNGVAIAQVGTVSSYTDSNLQPSSSYTYAVAAVDASSNTSAYSANATVQTPAAPDTIAPTPPPPDPTRPVLLGIAVSTSQINMNWQAYTDNIGVVGYDVYRASGGASATKIATVSALSYASAGLAANTSYTYYVIAKDAAGNASTQSNSITLTTFASAENGSIFGYVTDSTNNQSTIGGASVRVYVNGKRRSTKTNSVGNYIMTNIPSATYTFTYSKTGYQSKQVNFSIPPNGGVVPGNVNLVKN